MNIDNEWLRCWLIDGIKVIKINYRSYILIRS